MLSDTSEKLTPPNREIVAEIDELIERIKAIHEKHGRKVAKYIKRARKGRKAIAELEGLGATIPSALRALYWNWNGTGQSLPFVDASVFLNYMWSSADLQVDGYRIAQIEETTHATDSIGLFSGWGMDQLSIFPELSQGGDAPLAATAPWAQRIYFAFDGIVPMLRSFIAADEAGVISYAPERIDGEGGRVLVEQNEIQYDPAALWQAIEPLNPRAASEEHNYWRALATDTLEFDGTPPDISSGKIEMKPEVQEIVFREVIEQKRKWDEEFASGLRDPVTGKKRPTRS